MEIQQMTFDEISLLITHYNRSSSLERLLQAFKDQQLSFREIIVSDDGSKKEHLDYVGQLSNLYHFRLISSDRNRGLGNNINKGQQAVTSPFTLYVQEDFIPTDQFRERLKHGLSLMKDDSSIDLVRFYAYRKHPYLRPVSNGFYEMKFYFWRPNYWQFYIYSDHPHLRRSTFTEKFGKYAEGLHVERTEFKMSIKFLQKKGKSLIHENFRDIFIQKNTETEPGQHRKKFRKFRQSSNALIIKIARTVYRHIKFRYEYLFSGD